MFAHIMTLGGVRGFDAYAKTATQEFAKNLTLQQEIQQLLQQLVAQQQQTADGQQPKEQGQQPVWFLR